MKTGTLEPASSALGVVSYDNALALAAGDCQGWGHKTRVEPLATKIAPVSPPHGGPALLIRWEWNRFILRYQLAKLPVG
jgi:hypothetical protein